MTKQIRRARGWVGRALERLVDSMRDDGADAGRFATWRLPPF